MKKKWLMLDELIAKEKKENNWPIENWLKNNFADQSSNLH